MTISTKQYFSLRNLQIQQSVVEDSASLAAGVVASFALLAGVGAAPSALSCLRAFRLDRR